MKRKILVLSVLVSMFITPFAVSRGSTSSMSDFLSLSINPETIPAPGMSTTISVSMGLTCSKASYILLVAPPGAETVIESIVKDYKEAEFSWLSYKPKIMEILLKYEDETTIWYQFGELEAGETNDYPFPDADWKKLLGDDEANTNELGIYKVLLLGFCLDRSMECCKCCIRLDFSCSRFFVVPESMLGTLGPVAASILGIAALRFRKRR